MKAKTANQASSIEIAVLQDIWSNEAERAAVGLCPNCLVERTGAHAHPHAAWCAMKRDIAAKERDAAENMVCI